MPARTLGGIARSSQSAIPVLRAAQCDTALGPHITYTRATSGTRYNAAGVSTVMTAGQARINYDPVTLACLGALFEEQRSQLLLRSSELGTTWTLGGATPASLSANVTLAPDGTVSADRVTGRPDNSDRVQQTVTVSASTTYVLSHYAQNNSNSTRSKTHISFTNSGVTNSEIYPNWSGAAIASITQIGSAVAVSRLEGASFYRIQLRTISNGSDAGTATVRLYPAADQGATPKHLDFWGAMLEAATTDYPHATSYIPSAAAQVTRDADNATLVGAAFTAVYNAASWGAFVRFHLPNTSGTRPILSFDDGTVNNRIELYASGTSLKLKVVTGGVQQCDTTLATIAANTSYKLGLSQDAGAFLATLNGGTEVSATAASMPTVDRARLGHNQAGNYLNGHLHTWDAYRRTLPVRERLELTA